LTWKLKGTKFNRLLFQQHPKTLRTEEIEFGLLPTPTSVQRDHPERVEALKATGATEVYSRNNGGSRPNSIIDFMNFHEMLPTPNARDWKDSIGSGTDAPSIGLTRGYSLGQKINSFLPTPTGLNGDAYADNSPNSHLRHTPNIATLAAKGMLPTPTCQDAKMKENSPSQQHKIHELSIAVAGGSNSLLNPRFVAEMMGFPPNWTELPFLNGE
jgi:hypothetical protein